MKWQLVAQAAAVRSSSGSEGPDSQRAAEGEAPGSSLGLVSEALLGHALDAVSEGALVTDADQRIVYANAAFTAVTGYTAQETVGRNCRFLQGPETDPRTVTSLRMTLARQETFRGELLNYRKDGTPFWNALTVSPVRDGNGELTHFVSVQRDITAQRALQARLQSMALHDPLTGLPNRMALNQHMSSLAHRYQGSNYCVAVGIIDLDNFKPVNDNYGHEAGDSLLAEFAGRIRLGMRENDFLARLGGDEFAIVIEDLDSESAAEQLEGILASLREVVAADFNLDPAIRVQIQMSLGLAMFAPATESGEEVLRRADSALVDLKRRKASRNGWWHLETAVPAPPAPEHASGSLSPQAGEVLNNSNTAMTPDVRSRRDRLFNGGLKMYFQPVIDLRDGGLHLLEALARLQLEDGTILPPGSFLPQLDQEYTDALFRSSLDQTLSQLDSWDSAGLQLRASINAHPATLVNPQSPQWVASALDRHRISPHRLVLEVLENGIQERHAHNHSFSELRALGVGMAQDDLGAGHSSLRRLTSLPFDTVKIDHRVTAQLKTSPVPTLTFLATMVTMSESMGWQIIAEGLEDAGVTEVVAMLGIPYGQGYYLARPMPAEDVPAWIANTKALGCAGTIQTRLGALAFHWGHVRRVSQHPGPIQSCPLTAFLAAEEGANQARDWHKSQHRNTTDRSAHAEKLLEWLTGAASGNTDPVPLDFAG